jgi:hypothetical protein
MRLHLLGFKPSRLMRVSNVCLFYKFLPFNINTQIQYKSLIIKCLSIFCQNEESQQLRYFFI